MLIEQQLEAKVLSELATALSGDGFDSQVIYGIWQPSVVGVVKGIEQSQPRAVVEVKTSLAQNVTESAPACTVAVNVILNVRIDLDPQGVAFSAYAEKISNLFRAWQQANYQLEFTTLDVPGLKISDVAIGTATPSIVKNLSLANIAWPITLSGCFMPADNPQP